METVSPQILKGYELRERIGAGGFGAVYRAHQSTVGREVAIKIILPGLANQPDFIRRFESEAQIVARLEHPHITPLYDYWRDPDGAYLVMRWLRGGSLRDALQNGAFDLRSTALLLDQVAGALSLAHRNNVIHRDIKPGNILLDEDGNAYLTDFGIAKDLNVPNHNTLPDAIVGSLDYISPEQARSEPITPRTDIYSLGVTLYEVITGEHPFQNVSSIERLYKHINDPLPDVTTLDSTVAGAVNRVIQKATAKNPDHRYADALAFAADFREAIALIGAVGLIGLAVNQSQVAQHHAAEAQNLALINGSSAALANGNTDQAIALALEAVTIDASSSRAQVALSEAAYAPGTIRTLVGHTDSVDVAALSPDGHTAISASHDRTLILWDIQTGKALRHFEGHTDSVTSVAFTPDGLTAISGSADKTLIHWNIETGSIIRRFEGYSDAIWSVAISPDGQNVASGGTGNRILLWDIETGEMLRGFEGHSDGVQQIRFNADGSQFVSASNDRTVILWETATGNITHRFEDNTASVYTAIFSPDNRAVLSGADNGVILLLDIETGQMIRRISSSGGAVGDLAFSPDGRTIIAGGVEGLILWDFETAQPLQRLRGHSAFVNSVNFMPDGRTILTASGDNTLRVWDLYGGQVIHHFATGFGIWNAYDLSSDGQMVLASNLPQPLTSVVLWDTNTGMELRRYETEEFIYDLVLSPDGQMALLCTDTATDEPADIIVWDVNSGQEIRRFAGHIGIAASAAFSPDGHMVASVGGGRTLILWDSATGQEIRRFEGYENEDMNDTWNYVGFSPDGQTLITTDYGALTVLWDVTTGREIRQFKRPGRDTRNFVFSGDGQRALSGSTDGTTVLWDVASGAVLHTFSDHSAGIARVDMTLDGHLGISGSADSTTTLWDVTTGELIRRYQRSPYAPFFGPDNRTIFMGMFTDYLEIWRIDTTLDELLTWTRANRYIPELTCDQRELYRLEPLCEPETIQWMSES